MVKFTEKYLLMINTKYTRNEMYKRYPNLLQIAYKILTIVPWNLRHYSFLLRQISVKKSNVEEYCVILSKLICLVAHWLAPRLCFFFNSNNFFPQTLRQRNSRMQTGTLSKKMKDALTNKNDTKKKKIQSAQITTNKL